MLSSFYQGLNRRNKVLYTTARGICCSAAAAADGQQSKLAYEVINVAAEAGSKGSEPATAIFLHGLLGIGRNWRTVARKLAKDAAAETGRDWRMLLVDQRNHGSSTKLPGLEPPHSLQAAAQDLTHFIQGTLGGRVPEAIIGHSLGGKTTLELLQQINSGTAAIGPPDQAWVLDSNIGRARTDAGSDVSKVLEEVEGIPLPVPTRDWLYKYLGQRGYSEALSLWLGSNLVPDGQGKLTWSFNVHGAKDMFESYNSLDYWGLLRDPPASCTLNVVRAERSDRWPQKEINKLEECVQAAPSGLKVHVLPDAGHWVHTDNPSGLHDLILPSLVAAAEA